MTQRNPTRQMGTPATEVGHASRFRAQLATTTASAAGPYGYTLSLGGSVAVASGRLPGPGLAGALLLVAGAVAAFVLIEAFAQQSLQPSPTQDDEAPSIVGNAHLPSAGGAICAVWALVHVLGGVLAWTATGFGATLVYFVVTASQRIVTGRWARRGRARVHR